MTANAADDEVADGADEQAEAKPTKPSPRDIRKKARERLGNWSFLASHDPADPFRIVVEGDQIGSEGGDGVTIGTAITRASNFIHSLGARPRFTSLAFEKSVTLEFRAPDIEVARVRELLAEAEALAERIGDDATAEQRADLDDLFEKAVPDLVVAMTLAAELLETPSPRAPEIAVGFGSEVAETYKTLANAVGKSRLTISVETPNRDTPATLTPERAVRVAEELRVSTEPVEQVITAFGVLTIANQEAHGFGLRLDREARKHRLIKNKQVIHGTYLPEIEDAIREQGLWGTEVRARLRIVRDALVSTSTVRPPVYTLVGVAPRYEPQ